MSFSDRAGIRFPLSAPNSTPRPSSARFTTPRASRASAAPRQAPIAPADSSPRRSPARTRTSTSSAIPSKKRHQRNTSLPTAASRPASSPLPAGICTRAGSRSTWTTTRCLFNSVFNVKGVPLLYLPVMYYPTNKENRSTGFLLPTYGSIEPARHHRSATSSSGRSTGARMPR